MEKLQWITRENTWLNGTSHGWGNGYVVIPEGHPLHGKHYDELNDLVSVHGGLTFSEQATNKEWNQEFQGSWIVGFDTCHYADDMYRWPKNAVEAETKNLAEMLDKVTEDLIQPPAIDNTQRSTIATALYVELCRSYNFTNNERLAKDAVNAADILIKELS